MGAGGRYKLRIHGVGRAGTSTVFPQAVFALWGKGLCGLAGKTALR